MGARGLVSGMARPHEAWNTGDSCGSGIVSNAKHAIYRLVSLDGSPHPVLDAPYESIAAAEAAASRWCEGQGSARSDCERGIGLEVQTSCGEWRTLGYPSACLLGHGARAKKTGAP